MPTDLHQLSPATPSLSFLSALSTQSLQFTLVFNLKLSTPKTEASVFGLPDCLRSSAHWGMMDGNNSKYPNNCGQSMIDRKRRLSRRPDAHGWVKNQLAVADAVDSTDRQDVGIDRRRGNSKRYPSVFCLTIDRVTWWGKATRPRWRNHLSSHSVSRDAVAMAIREVAFDGRVADRVDRPGPTCWYRWSHCLPRQSVRSSSTPVESVADDRPRCDYCWSGEEHRSASRSVSHWIDANESEGNLWVVRSVFLNHCYCWTIRFVWRSKNLRDTLSRTMQSIDFLPKAVGDSPARIWSDSPRLFDWPASS